MKKLLFICVIVGLYFFKPELFNFSGSNVGFDTDGNPQVLLFTSSACGQSCSKSIQELKKRKVVFQELPMDENDVNQSLFKKSRGRSLPHMVAGKQTVQGYDKAEIAAVLAQNFGDEYLTRIEKRYFENHFYEDGTPKVYMYGASWCGYCKKMRQKFNDKNIDYEELDVEKASNQDLITDIMRITGYPVIYVGYLRINGANFNQVLKAMKIAKNRTT